MWKSLYESPWIATFGLAVISLGSFGLWLARRPFLYPYVALFTIVALADALAAGAWSPIHSFAPRWEEPVGLVFVIAGDLRFFLLVERYAWRPDAGPYDRTSPAAWASAAGLTAIAPLTLGALRATVGAPFSEARPSYMTYEAIVVAVVLLLRLVVMPRRLTGAPPAVRRWLGEVMGYEVVMYGLWLVADGIITAGADVGFLLRVVPNVLYYGTFVAFCALRAPRETSEAR